MINVNTAAILTEVEGGLFTYILGLIHFPTKEMIYLYGHSFLEILLDVKSDVGSSRVWIQLYLLASFRSRNAAGRLTLGVDGCQ